MINKSAKYFNPPPKEGLTSEIVLLDNTVQNKNRP